MVTVQVGSQVSDCFLLLWCLASPLAMVQSNSFTSFTVEGIKTEVGDFTGPLAIGIADQVSYECRSAAVHPKNDSGILGLGLASTVTGWPGTNGPFKPMWLQLLEGTQLEKKFSVSLVTDPNSPIMASYNGTLEIGGPVAPPPSNALTIPVVPVPNTGLLSEWRVKAQFSALSRTSRGDRFYALGDPMDVILDTGANK